jgi:hypothetical protein
MVVSEMKIDTNASPLTTEEHLVASVWVHEVKKDRHKTVSDIRRDFNTSSCRK